MFIFLYLFQTEQIKDVFKLFCPTLAIKSQWVQWAVFERILRLKGILTSELFEKLQEHPSMSIFQTEMQHGLPCERNSNFETAFSDFFFFQNSQTFSPINHSLIFIKLVKDYLFITWNMFAISFLLLFRDKIFFLFFFTFLLFYFKLCRRVFIWGFWRRATSMILLKFCGPCWFCGDVTTISLFFPWGIWFFILRCLFPFLCSFYL